jgi:hypothetical protein
LHTHEYCESLGGMSILVRWVNASFGTRMIGDKIAYGPAELAESGLRDAIFGPLYDFRGVVVGECVDGLRRRPCSSSSTVRRATMSITSAATKWKPPCGRCRYGLGHPSSPTRLPSTERACRGRMAPLCNSSIAICGLFPQHFNPLGRSEKTSGTSRNRVDT